MFRSWLTPWWIRGKTRSIFPNASGLSKIKNFQDMIFLETYYMNLGYVSEVVLKEMVDNNLRLFCIYDIYKKNIEVPSILIDRRKLFIRLLS